MATDTVPKIEPVDTSILPGDWRDDLFKNGYVVVNVIDPKKAEAYVESMFDWLESFPYGFKRDDKSTWTEEYLPGHVK